MDSGGRERGIIACGGTTVDVRRGDIPLLSLYGLFRKNNESFRGGIGSRGRTKLEEGGGRVCSASRASSGEGCGGDAGRRYSDAEEEW